MSTAGSEGQGTPDKVGATDLLVKARELALGSYRGLLEQEVEAGKVEAVLELEAFDAWYEARQEVLAEAARAAVAGESPGQDK